MSKDINSRLSDLKSRRRGISSIYALDSINSATASVLKEKFEQRADGEWSKYALGAMEEVDQTYTKNSIAEGERVKSQISNRLNTNVTFDYQGSVPLNVHIKGVSDIDILVLLKDFVTIDRHGAKANSAKYSTWTGPTAVVLLTTLRSDLEALLKESFPKVNIDVSGDKAIGMSGGSLSRKVDIVPSHWHDSAAYQLSESKIDREVKILERKKALTFLNRPFLHIDKINTKDSETRGGTKKIIRMLKNLKADSENADLILVNSYEIAGLVYHFENSVIDVPIYNELALVAATQQQLNIMINNKAWAMSLGTPDGIRKILESEEKFNSLRTLHNEVSELVKNLAIELSTEAWLTSEQEINTLKKSYIRGV
jgi:hypothetical protein